MINEVVSINRMNSSNIKDDSKIKSFPNALLFHLFSFMEESDLACFSSSGKLLSFLQKQYKTNLNGFRYNAWKKIISSQPSTLELPDGPYTFRLIKNHLFWDDPDSGSKCTRYFMDLTRLSITKIQLSYDNIIRIIQGNGIDAVMSSPPSLNSRGLIVFDNEQRSQLYTINLEEYSKAIFIDILGTKRKNQTLEFVTHEGVILQLDLNKFCKEKGNKKVIQERQLNIFSCRPKKFQNTSILSDAFKIKKIYYLRWRNDSKDDVSFSVIALKDLDYPNQKTILQNNSEDCVSDDHFLYVALKNVITIYKGETIWKKIILNKKLYFNLSLNPTNYGLVVTFDNKRNTQISIWNHRKYDSKKVEVITPMFMKIVKGTAPIFIQNDLLIYEEDRKCKVFHLAQREFVGDIQMNGIGIRNVVTSSNDMPEHFIIEHENRLRAKHKKIQIFSNKTIDLLRNC